MRNLSDVFIIIICNRCKKCKKANKYEEGIVVLNRFRQIRYKKTTLTLVIVIIVSFLMLLTAFYKIISSSVNEVRCRQLYRAADELSERLTLLWKLENTGVVLDSQYSQNAIAENMRFITKLTNAYAWLVRPDGQIIYRPETMEDDMGAKLFKRHPDTGRETIPQKYVGNDLPDEGIIIKGGNFQGFFSPVGSSWLSVVKPISLGQKRLCYLHIHERVSMSDDIRLYLLNGLAISLFVAIVVALLFVWVFTQELSRPITLLSDAANKVALGDFSVQVSLPPAGMLSFVDENSDLNNLISTFNRMIQKLGDANTAQRDFISSISHDIRTPLTSIIGFSGAIMDGTVGKEDQEHYLSIIHSESVRLASLVRSMNDVVQLDQHEIHYEFTDFNLVELIQDVVNNLTFILDEKSITVQTDPSLSFGNVINVYGDRSQIQRVLINLIQNASKFVEQGGVIAIAALCTKSKGNKANKLIQIDIEDNGPGVSPEDRDHIFERFYKSDRSRTGKSGSGLGLHICKQILAAHGQFIWLDESNMGGAKFSFTLQLSDNKIKKGDKHA